MVSSAFEANTIFNIGNLAGLVYSTVARNDMNILEPLIVLGFSVGGAIVGVLDPKNVHHPNDPKSLRARLVHLCGTALLYLPLLCYWIWFSFDGMDQMSRRTECPAWTFMLYRVDARAAWFRVVMKTATVASIVGFVALGMGCTYASVTKRPLRHHGHPHIRPPRLGRTATALALRARPSKLQFLIVILASAMCALSVELSIIWNKIEGVNMLGATGQLIPMAIGLLTSIRVVVGIISGKVKKGRKKAKEKAELERFGGGGEAIVVGPNGECAPVCGDQREWRDVERWHAVEDQPKKRQDGKPKKRARFEDPVVTEEVEEKDLEKGVEEGEASDDSDYDDEERPEEEVGQPRDQPPRRAGSPHPHPHPYTSPHHPHHPHTFPHHPHPYVYIPRGRKKVRITRS